MKKVIVLSFMNILLAVLPLSLVAQENEEPATSSTSHLFVTTSPLGASVYINDELAPHLSPMLKSKIPAGTYTIRVLRSGYIPVEKRVTLEKAQALEVKIALYRPAISLAFPLEPRVISDGQIMDGGDVALTIPEGLYKLDKEGGILSLQKVFPQQELLNTASILLPLGILASAGLTLVDINQTEGRPFVLSPYTLTTYSITMALVGINMILGNRKSKFDSEKNEILLENARLRSARELWERGQEFQALGQLDSALEAYQTLLQNHQDSPLFPRALYTASRIQGLLGWDTLARTGLEILTEKFPTIDTYDKAQKALAELALRDENKNRALLHYRSMILADPEISLSDQESGLALAEALP